ncbi:MAG: hypothetical protein EOO92_19770, partial [Pedobacter sp.]
TMLPGLLKPKRLLEEYVDYFITKPTMELIFKYHTHSEDVINKIKSSFKIPDMLPTATSVSPLELKDAESKSTLKMSYWLYKIQNDLDNIPTAKYPGYQSFPGSVPTSAKRINKTITIPVQVGTQGLPDVRSVYYRPHSTGLYVPAGETVKITVPDLNEFMEAQIGIHDDDVTHLDKITRIGTNLVKKFKLNKGTTEIFSPFGGLLMINIGDTSALKKLTIQVDGAVEAPYFRLGETTEEEWIASVRNNPAPWAELATDKIVLTVPAYRIKNLNNPVKLMEFWDEVMDADADLAGISRKRVHNERIIVDNDVAYGYMFTMYNKIVVPDDESCEWMLDVDFLRTKGSWGTLHELGHRHQFFDLDFQGTSEVTVNLFTTYVYDQVLKKGLYNHDNIPNKEAATAKIKKYLSDTPTYEKWQEDPFLALSMYIQIVDNFGWKPIIEANKIYRNLPKKSYPKSNQEKCDLWFDTICKTTKSNLTDFFKVWKIPVSKQAVRNVMQLKQWYPEELIEFKK